MNKQALKAHIETEIREYKKEKRRKAKRKECPSCGVTRYKHQFRGKHVCLVCDKEWEAREAERHLEIRENVLYNQFTRRLAIEEEKENGKA